MNQRAAQQPLRIFLLVIAAASAIAAGCGSRHSTTNTTSTTQPAAGAIPRIASLVPAATDMLMAMGAGDRLVAVSNYDLTPATASLPRVGDYQTTDWEKISQLHPTAIITEFGPGRTPPGFTERCATLGIRQINVHIQRLADIYATLAQLGDAAGEADWAAATAKKLQDQIADVRGRVSGEHVVPALIVTGEDTLNVAGTDNYLDDLLIAAGGKNVVTAPGYPTLDREKLASLAPEAIIQLLPSADSRNIAAAQQLWASFPDIPAVRNGRVTMITESYAELPGFEVGSLASTFAKAMHPKTPGQITMTRWGPFQLLGTLAIAAVGWTVVAAACLCVGSTGPIGWPPPGTLPYRSDPVLIASLAGAALAAAGVVYQAILRNPLADPYLLGVSSGASLAAFLWRLPIFLAVGPMLTAIGEQGFAFAGAIAAVTVVLLLGTRRGRLEPVTVLLVGVIVNAINGSIFLLINARYPDATAGSGGALSFLVGGIQSNLTTGEERAATICCVVGWIILMAITGQLNAAMLGDAEAQALGIRLHRLRWTALGIASIVTAAAVAITGPIGFVGLIAPHMARLLLGTDQRKLLPVATAIGASLLALADAASRLLAADKFFNTLLPVGVLTALLGGPFFLLLLWQQRRDMNRG